MGYGEISLVIDCVDAGKTLKRALISVTQHCVHSQTVEIDQMHAHRLTSGFIWCLQYELEIVLINGLHVVVARIYETFTCTGHCAKTPYAFFALNLDKNCVCVCFPVSWGVAGEVLARLGYYSPLLADDEICVLGF